MNVSLHARAQLLSRMPARDAVAIIGELEATAAPKESEARIIRRFDTKQAKDNRWGLSNGQVLVVIIEHQSVKTVYWRREGQPMTAEHFRVKRVRDMTPEDQQRAAMARIEVKRQRETQSAIRRLQKAWGAR